jgi:hypothetical protein
MLRGSHQNNPFDARGCLPNSPGPQFFREVQHSLDQNTRNDQYPPELSTSTIGPQHRHSFQPEGHQSVSGDNFEESNTRIQANVQERNVCPASMLGPRGRHSFHPAMNNLSNSGSVFFSSPMPESFPKSIRPSETLSSLEVQAQDESEMGVDSPMDGQKQEATTEPVQKAKKSRQKRAPSTERKTAKKCTTSAATPSVVAVASPMPFNSNFSSEDSISPASPCPESKTEIEKPSKLAHNTGMAQNDERMSAMIPGGQSRVTKQPEENLKRRMEWNAQQDLLEDILVAEMATNGANVGVPESESHDETSKPKVPTDLSDSIGNIEESTQQEVFPDRDQAGADGTNSAMMGSLQSGLEFLGFDIHGAVEKPVARRDQAEEEHAALLREILALADTPDSHRSQQVADWDKLDGESNQVRAPSVSSVPDFSEAMVDLDTANNLSPPSVEFNNAWPDNLLVPEGLCADVWNDYGSIGAYTWFLDDFNETPSGLRTPGRLD